MIRKRSAVPLAAASLLAAHLVWPAAASGWGFASHRMVEEEAIETLPEPLRGWFREHREEISDWSIDPDTVLRERHGREEAVRHFIDLDLYGRPPFRDLPRSYEAAVARYGREQVEARGTVPWTIEEKHVRLVRELRRGKWREALRTAAYAGHYVADATMPLHAVSDYDGKAAGVPGIHRAVEHEVVDERIREYRRQVRAAVRPARASQYGSEQLFDVLFESYAAVPELVSEDREARRRTEFRTPRWAEAVDRAARPLLVRRLVRAVDLLGAFWLSAWNDAGNPTPPRRAR
jgi:hypothetical protein